MQKTLPSRGFTLIELLIVMGVILILAGIVVGVQRSVFFQQSQARAKSDLQTIALALETFKQKYGDYPWLQTTDEKDTTQADRDLYEALTGQLVLNKPRGSNTTFGMNKPQDFEGNDTIAPPLIDENLIEASGGTGSEYFIDPWGNPYKYYYKTSASDSWNHTGFILLSIGPDRENDSHNDFTSGDFPISANDYYDLGSGDNNKADNIVYGLEAQ